MYITVVFPLEDTKINAAYYYRSHLFWSEKLADAQNVAEKLAKLPEKVLLYIAGYAEGALAAAGKQAATEQPGA